MPPPAQKSLLPARAVEWGSEPFKAAIARDNRQPVSDNQVLSWRFDFDLAPSVSPGSSMETWRPVFALHGLPLHPLASTAGRAALDVCLNGAALSAWTRTPHGRDAGFHTVFSAVAEHLQRVARAWIPAAFFSSPGRLNDSAAAATLLAYGATPVFRGGGRADYAWDTMNPGDVAKALAAAAGHLPLRLARLNMELKREGHPGAALLAPGLASRFIDKVAANRRMYHLLLAFDSFLIEDVIRMAESARDMRQRMSYGADTLARRLQHESPAFLRAVHARFRQLGDYPELLRLGELLLMEATAALAATRTDAAFSVQSGGFVTAWTPRRALDEALAA